MADIFINIQRIEASNRELQRTLLELSEVENNIALIRRGLSADIRRRCGINEQLNRLSREASAMRHQVKQLLQVTKAGMDAYRTAEYQLSHGVLSER